MNFKIFLFLVFVFCTLRVSTTNAQDFILFQLPSSTSQIKAAETVGDAKAVVVFKRSDSQIKQAIIKSFQEDFTYCTVYFFSSDDYDKVKSKDFEKVSFYNKKSELTTLPKEMTNYQIANISFFPKELTKVEKNGEEVYEQGVEDHFGKGIILNDKAFKPVKGKLRFTPCKITRRGSILNPRKRYYVFKGVESFNSRLLKFGSK